MTIRGPEELECAKCREQTNGDGVSCLMCDLSPMCTSCVDGDGICEECAHEFSQAIAEWPTLSAEVRSETVKRCIEARSG